MSSVNAVPAGERELRAQLAVQRVALRGEHRQRVGAALEEDGDEDRLRRAGVPRGDAFLERAQAELRRAVDGEHGAERRR